MAALRVLIAGGSPRSRANYRDLLVATGRVTVVESADAAQVTLLDLTEAAEGAALPGDTNGPTLALLGDGSPSGLPAQLWGAGVSYVSDAVSRGGLVAALEATAAGLQVRDPPPVRRPAPLRADPAPADGATLTEREREILRLLGEGLGNRDMAEALGVSDHTVKFHLHSIFQKLGVRSRTEAVSVAVRRGLLML